MQMSDSVYDKTVQMKNSSAAYDQQLARIGAVCRSEIYDQPEVISDRFYCGIPAVLSPGLRVMELVYSLKMGQGGLVEVDEQAARGLVGRLIGNVQPNWVAIRWELDLRKWPSTGALELCLVSRVEYRSTMIRPVIEQTESVHRWPH